MKRLITVYAILVASTLRADVKLPAVFGDHMVVQREMRFPVWGSADAGKKITVKAASQEKSTTADDHGKWRIALDPIASNDPIEITVTGKNTITIKDVLVGEVWLCSGQSNMGFTLKNAANAKEALKSADQPKIRLFKVAQIYKDQPQEDVVGKWEVCTPATAEPFSAVAYFFGAELHCDLDRPVGLICSEWGGTRAEAWIPRQTFDELKLPYEPEWTQTWLHPKQRPAATQPEKVRPYEAPSTIYNAMIAPIATFAIKGVVWYQGETNTAYPVDYRRVLGALVTSWRTAWTRDDIPFLIVQLPNYESSGRDWVALRKSQQQVSKELPNVALAITIDLGDTRDPKNIHPPYKAPVGHRLALLAEKLTYGKDVPCYGPTVKLVKISGSQVMVAFEHADGLKSKGDVKGFEIAGEDGKFVPATGKIDGDKVILSTTGVAPPKSVRYGWTNNPTCTLYNGADLPAVPFEAKHD